MSKKRFHESSDSSMISESKSSVANLPQEVIIKPWSKVDSDASSTYNDTVSGIDSQLKEDNAGAKRRRGGFKY